MRSTSWLDPLLAFGALAGVAFGVLTAGTVWLLGLFSLAAEDAEGATLLLGLAASLLLGGLAGLPLLYWTLRAMFSDRPLEPGRAPAAWGWLGLFFPGALGLGYLAFDLDVLPGLLGPLAQVAAAGIPVVLIAVRARRLAPPITPRRGWANFLAGLWVAPAIAFTLEMLLLLPLGLALILGLRADPAMRALLEGLSAAAAPDPDLLIEQAQALLVHPATLLVGGGFLVVLVPLLEEAIKSIGIWPLLSRRPSPGEAFLAGVLTGAGYALFEALLLPQPGPDWVVTMLARVGATLMHVLTAGITCWAVAEAFVRGRWHRLALAFALAVGFHGLWNLAALGLGIAAVPEAAPALLPDSLARAATAGVATLALLSLTAMALLGIPWLTRRLTHQHAPPVLTDEPPAPPPPPALT